MRFYTADLTDYEWWQNHARALIKYRDGEKPTFSTGICGSLTAGYGRLDELGYWEFPLYVDQETMEVVL